GIAITNPGAGFNNFTSPPTVNITGGGGSSATATAALSGVLGTGIVTDSGAAAALTVTDSGTHSYSGGITGPLSLAMSGTGSLTLGTLNTYTGTTTISNGTVSAGSVVVTTGAVTATTITNVGTNYTSPPTVSFTGGGGSGAAATAVLSGTSIIGITITSGGSG